MRFKPKVAAAPVPEKKPDGRKGNGGARPGSGRRAGIKNKATLEREEKARLDAQKAQTGIDVPLAKQVLEELMSEALTMARKYAPSSGVKFDGKKGKERQRFFREWSNLAAMWAGRLAPYQSPTFKAIQINPMDNQRTPGAVVTELLDAIDDESRGEPLQIGGPMPERAA